MRAGTSALSSPQLQNSEDEMWEDMLTSLAAAICEMHGSFHSQRCSFSVRTSLLVTARRIGGLVQALPGPLRVAAHTGCGEGRTAAVEAHVPNCFRTTLRACQRGSAPACCHPICVHRVS